jgi:hypothetical protein
MSEENNHSFRGNGGASAVAGRGLLAIMAEAIPLAVAGLASNYIPNDGIRNTIQTAIVAAAVITPTVAAAQGYIRAGQAKEDYKELVKENTELKEMVNKVSHVVSDGTVTVAQPHLQRA